MDTNESPKPVKKNETKTIILDIALELFAEHGSHAVSLRDIAERVGIKMASIYYYYKSKNELIEDIFDIFISCYKSSFESLSEKNANANTLEEVMDNIFADSFLPINTLNGCFGMALITKEQHTNEYARRCIFEVFYDYSINNFKNDFDRLIEKGIIPPSDTRTIASILMLCLIEINDMRIHQHLGKNLPLNGDYFYTGLKKQLTILLKHGG